MSYYIERPYRQLYPPEPVRKRHIVSTKDDVYVDENGAEVRVPVEDRPGRTETPGPVQGKNHLPDAPEPQAEGVHPHPRPPQQIIRTTTFGIEIIDQENPTP